MNPMVKHSYHAVSEAELLYEISEGSLYPCRTMVVQLPVKEKVVGSSPTTGALQCQSKILVK